MAKSFVERAPKINPNDLDLQSIKKYMHNYHQLDDKGRYLHWSELKKRLRQNEEKAIWRCIKFKRQLSSTTINLLDNNGAAFSYSFHNQMHRQLNSVEIMAAGYRSNHIGNGDIDHELLFPSLVMEEAITSAQLEGAAVTRAKAKDMLEKNRKPIDQDEQMIVNNYRLLNYAKHVKDKNLTIELILEFHRLATQETDENNVIPGEFRTDNDIYVADPKGEIAYQPPCYGSIPSRMQSLCDFANSDHINENSPFIPSIIKAIILHFMVGYEHPFRDGNGRTARALFYWFVLKSGYDLFEFASISKFLNTHARDYGLSYLYTEKDENDLTYFIDFQLKAILAAFEELKHCLSYRATSLQDMSELLQGSKYDSLNFIQVDILRKAMNKSGQTFTAKNICTVYGVSENTARTYLKQLADENLLYVVKKGKQSIYISHVEIKNIIEGSKKKG